MKLTQRARKFVPITADALAKAGASSVLALAASAIGGTVAMLADAPENEPPQDSIGVVRIDGALAQRAVADLCAYVDGYDAITARFQAAIADKRVAGVLLVIDSPGGDVPGLEEAIRRMRAMADHADKPVVAFADEFAASAAYWIAAGVADEVVLPPSARIGSIGCIAAWVDASAAMKADGYEWHIIREPAGKAAESPLGPVADVADERVGALVKQAAGRFFTGVSERRGISTKDVRGMNGALFSGADAVDQKLADHVGTLEDAANRVLELAQERRAKRGKEKQMKLTAIAAALCGLSADASPEAAEVALATTAKDILDATGAKSLDKVPAAVEAMKLELAAHAEKAEKLAALEAKLAEDEKAAKAAKLAATIDAAVKAGKVTPAKRGEIAEKAGKFGQDWLDALVESLPVQGGTESETKSAAATVSDHTVGPELKAELSKLGLTVEDHLKFGRKVA